MTKKISGTIEFISAKGERGGIDAQINDWLAANPALDIVDVKYRANVYQDGGKTRIAKFALVLYAEGAPQPAQAKQEVKEEEREPKPEEIKPQGARTMVMSLRKELMDAINEDE